MSLMNPGERNVEGQGDHGSAEKQEDGCVSEAIEEGALPCEKGNPDTGDQEHKAQE